MSYDNWKTDIDSWLEPVEPEPEVEPDLCSCCHTPIMDVPELDPACLCEAAAFLEDATEHVLNGRSFIRIGEETAPDEVREAVVILSMAWLRTQHAAEAPPKNTLAYVRQIIEDGPGDEENPF